MKNYDVFIAGGAVAGPVAAAFCAEAGLTTLLIERDQVPRHKACSGIQFPYFEDIIEEKIPADRLCNNTLSEVEIHMPNGKVTSNALKMINFMRKPLDHWLCERAVEKGSEFRDQCAFKDLTIDGDSYIITLKTKDGEEKISADYVIDGTGLRPSIRKVLRPNEGYEKGSSGATLNYYFSVESTDLEPQKLYQIWNMEFNNMMFAWIYNKTLDDGKDYWVVGTGYDSDIKKIQEKFFQWAVETFNCKGVKIVKKEGYSSSLSFSDENRIWLGQKNILMTGDAAGLVDLTRGVGMDSAALSGRVAAKAIIESKKKDIDAIKIYEKKMKKLVSQTRKNHKKGIQKFENNEDLHKYLTRGFLIMGFTFVKKLLFNKFKKPENYEMIP